MAVQYENTDKPSEKAVQIHVEPTVYRRCHSRYKPHMLILGSLLVLLLILIVVWMIILLIKYESPNVDNIVTALPQEFSTSTPSVTTKPTFDLAPNSTFPHELKVISRMEWLATPPIESPAPLRLPVPYVIISHTATENCTNLASCSFHVRFIQTFHMENRNWFDISYNFLVGGDGFAYEGRGWKTEGAHTSGYNSKSIGIGFLGTFNSYLPPEKQIIAAKKLIERGVELGYIAPDYKMLAARQITTTQSPGLMLYENLRTWPHWSEQP